MQFGNTPVCPTFEYVQGIRDLEQLIHALQRGNVQSDR
jgi:hypothetical protein